MAGNSTGNKGNPGQTFSFYREEPLLLVPRVEELTCDSISIYDIAEYYSGRPHFAFLDSRMHENRLGRYSFIAFDPFLIFKSKGNKVRVGRGDGEPAEEIVSENIFDTLNRVLSRYRMPFVPGVPPVPAVPGVPGTHGEEAAPFLGGGIGYFAYELGRQNEVLPTSTRDVMHIPECYICFYNAVIIYNHEKEKMFISYIDLPGGSPSSFEQLKKEIAAVPPGLYLSKGISPGWTPNVVDLRKNEINQSFLGVQPGGAGSPLEQSPLVTEGWAHFRRDFTRQEYMAAVRRIKEYILAGDVYQVDLTQRFETGMEGIPPWELYKRLIHINPSPFAAFLNFDGVTVVSSSPERFLLVKGNEAETRPLKGTVKRGATPGEDEKNKRFLVNDEKNRAELAMIVDLMRNDLGRVCKAGTVKVEGFPVLETYPSVHHLAAAITGQLAEGKNITDLLKAAFPGGSITGAPKIRAMEILDELEPVERGIYTGSIGYLGFNGCADLNIAIRTIVITGQTAHIQAGGGIVADSVDSGEYRETLLKAQKLFGAFGHQGEVE